MGRPAAQRARRLDGRLAASLIGLPEQVTGAVDVAAYHSLAARDLLRGETTDLPSGEAVARLVGVPPLTADELEYAWPHGTPLWFYILKEAEHHGGGDRLGPVGGRIVTEVLIGLLRADPAAYLSLQPDWAPTLPAAGMCFGLADLLVLGEPDGRPRTRLGDTRSVTDLDNPHRDPCHESGGSPVLSSTLSTTTAADRHCRRDMP